MQKHCAREETPASSRRPPICSTGCSRPTSAATRTHWPAASGLRAVGFADLIATATDGTLHYWHNSGHGTFTKLPNTGAGWETLEWFAVVDVNGDNKSDIVGRDGGRLYWYPGKGAGAFSQRVFIGEGWATYPQFAGGDADADGDGNGTFSSGRQAGSGWGAFGPFNVLDVNGDAKADLVAVRTSGELLVVACRARNPCPAGDDAGGVTGKRCPCCSS